MARLKEKEKMLEYVVKKFKETGEFKSVKNIDVYGVPTNIISYGDRRLVLIVDKLYVHNKLKKVFFERPPNSEMDFIFFKDGKSFFRKSSDKDYFKDMIDDRQKEEMEDRVILFRPEETFVSKIKGKRLVYYDSYLDRYKEGMVCYQFQPIIYDLSNIPPANRFGSEMQVSSKNFYWTNKYELPESMPITSLFANHIS